MILMATAAIKIGWSLTGDTWTLKNNGSATTGSVKVLANAAGFDAYDGAVKLGAFQKLNLAKHAVLCRLKLHQFSIHYPSNRQRYGTRAGTVQLIHRNPNSSAVEDKVTSAVHHHAARLPVPPEVKAARQVFCNGDGKTPKCDRNKSGKCVSCSACGTSNDIETMTGFAMVACPKKLFGIYFPPKKRVVGYFRFRFPFSL